MSRGVGCRTCFTWPQPRGSHRRETVRAPANLRQGEQHRNGGDKPAHYKGDANLYPLQPRIDPLFCHHPQFVMHHRTMPAFIVGSQMVNHAVEEWTTEALVLVDCT